MQEVGGFALFDSNCVLMGTSTTLDGLLVLIKTRIEESLDDESIDSCTFGGTVERTIVVLGGD